MPSLTLLSRYRATVPALRLVHVAVLSMFLACMGVDAAVDAILLPSSFGIGATTLLWLSGLALMLFGAQTRPHKKLEVIPLAGIAGMLPAAIAAGTITGDLTDAQAPLTAGTIIAAVHFLSQRVGSGGTLATDQMPYLQQLQAGLAVVFAAVTSIVWWLIDAPTIGISAGCAALVLAWPHIPALLGQLTVRNSLLSARTLGADIVGANALGVLARAEHIAFDKASLLERDMPVVTDVQAFDNQPERLLSIAASAENKARHPIATAIRTIAQDWDVAVMSPDEFEEVPGLGCVALLGGKSVAVGNQGLMRELSIDCFTANALCKPFQTEGKTSVYIAVESRLVGLIALQAGVDPATSGAIAGLKARSVGITLVTGTDAQTAAGFGKSIGVERVIADMPQAGRFAAAEAGLDGQAALFVSRADSGRRGIFNLAGDASDTERLVATLEPGRLDSLVGLLSRCTAAQLQLHRRIQVSVGCSALAGLAGGLSLVPLPVAGLGALALPLVLLVLFRR